MTKHARFRSFALLGAISLASAPSAALSQDLRYEMVTRSEIGGTAGRLMRSVPGSSDPLRETTFIKGNRIRRDDGTETSTIMDWDSGVLTILDHPGRTYVQVSLEQMAEAAEEVAEALQENSSEIQEAVAEGAQQAAQEAEAAHAAEGGDQTSLDVMVSSDRTGQVRDFSGYTAEQVLITLEILGQHTPGEYDEEIQSGGVAIVTELWLSQDFPEFQRMQDMRGEALDKMKERDTGKGILGSLESLLTYDPRIQFAFEKNRETIDAMDGIALRTAMHVVTLTDGVPLDRDRVLADQDRRLTDDAMDAANSGAKEAARSTVRNVTGRLFGRNRDPEPEPEPEQPKQSVFLRIISEVANVETAALDEALFTLPPDYAPETNDAGSGGP